MLISCKMMSMPMATYRAIMAATQAHSADKDCLRLLARDFPEYVPVFGSLSSRVVTMGSYLVHPLTLPLPCSVPQATLLSIYSQHYQVRGPCSHTSGSKQKIS